MPIQRVKLANGQYRYVQVGEDNKPTEFDENTGKFKMYSSPSATGDFTWGWKNTDTNDMYGYTYDGPDIVITGNPNRKIGIQRTQDDHWAALDRDKKVDEQVNQTVGSADNFTPWGLGGQAINYGFGKVSKYIPEEVGQALSYGRYMSPAYWSDRIAGKSDEEIMNGQGNLFGTGTGTIMDFMTGSTLLKPINKTTNSAFQFAGKTVRNGMKKVKNWWNPGYDMDQVLAYNGGKQNVYNLNLEAMKNRFKRAGLSEADAQRYYDYQQQNIRNAKLANGDPSGTAFGQVQSSENGPLVFLRRNIDDMAETANHEVVGHASTNGAQFLDSQAPELKGVFDYNNSLTPKVRTDVENIYKQNWVDNGNQPNTFSQKAFQKSLDYITEPEEVRARVNATREYAADILRKRYAHIEATDPIKWDEMVTKAVDSMFEKGKSHGLGNADELINTFDKKGLQMYNNLYLYKKGGLIQKFQNPSSALPYQRVYTGDFDKLTFKDGDPLNAYLKDEKLEGQDMGDYYEYKKKQFWN